MPAAPGADGADLGFAAAEAELGALREAVARLASLRAAGARKQPRLLLEAAGGEEPSIQGRAGLAADAIVALSSLQARELLSEDPSGFSAALRALDEVVEEEDAGGASQARRQAFPGWADRELCSLVVLRAAARIAQSALLAHALRERASNFDTDFRFESFQALNGVSLPVSTLRDVVRGAWLDDEAINAMLLLFNRETMVSPFRNPRRTPRDPWADEDVEGCPEAGPGDRGARIAGLAGKHPALARSANAGSRDLPFAVRLDDVPSLLPRAQVLYMNSHFFEALKTRSAEAVLPWLDKTRRDFQRIRVFGCPINLQNVHWVAIAVDFCTRTVVYSDSLGRLNLDICSLFLDFLRRAAGRFGVSQEDLLGYSVIGCGEGVPARDVLEALAPLEAGPPAGAEEEHGGSTSEEVFEITSSDEGGAESSDGSAQQEGAGAKDAAGEPGAATTQVYLTDSRTLDASGVADPPRRPVCAPPANELLSWIEDPATASQIKLARSRLSGLTGADLSQGPLCQDRPSLSEPAAEVLRARLCPLERELSEDLGPTVAETAASLVDQVLHALASPRQENGSDCGVFSLSFLRFMASGPPCSLRGLSAEARASLARELAEGALAPR